MNMLAVGSTLAAGGRGIEARRGMSALAADVVGHPERSPRQCQLYFYTRLTARGGPPRWTRHAHSTSSGSIEKLRGELAWRESILPSLEVYAQEHSDCFVPRNFVVPAHSPWPTPAWGHRLGAIVSDIRACRRYALQSTRDADRLAAINFAWDVRDYKWRHVVFPALEAFASEHGHCKVPSTFVVPSMAPWPRDAWGYKLGVCVQGIRHHGLYSEQVTRDASRLTAFDFSQTSHEFKWRYTVLPALIVFADTYGHCNVAFAFVVPAESPWPAQAWGLKLGRVVSNMRSLVSYGSQMERDAAALQAIGFVSSSSQFHWAERIVPSLETFHRREGHAEVPLSFVVPSESPWPEQAWGLQLGRVVDRIKRHKVYAKFVEHDAARLVALGFQG